MQTRLPVSRRKSKFSAIPAAASGKSDSRNLSDATYIEFAFIRLAYDSDCECDIYHATDFNDTEDFINDGYDARNQSFIAVHRYDSRYVYRAEFVPVFDSDGKPIHDPQTGDRRYIKVPKAKEAPDWPAVFVENVRVQYGEDALNHLEDYIKIIEDNPDAGVRTFSMETIEALTVVRLYSLEEVNKFFTDYSFESSRRSVQEVCRYFLFSEYLDIVSRKQVRIPVFII